MLYTLIALLLATTPLAAATTQTTKTEETKHHLIDANQLKSWYDQNKPMVVVDARSAKYFDGTLLPNAKWLPAESTEQEIEAAIPSKNTLVVVYCLGVTCPASGWLYDKLATMGYKNVYEYHEGLQDWKQKGYSTTTK